MTSLDWFPYDTAWWRELSRALSVEEEGALHRVCRVSWDEKIPGTIADTPAALENILGARARKLAPLIQSHFTRSPEHPGLLRCAWLADLHAQQLAKYLSRAHAGREGAIATNRARASGNADGNADGNGAKKRTRKRGNADSAATGNAASNAEATPSALPAQREEGASHRAPSGPGVRSTPPDGQRAALEGALSPGAEGEMTGVPLAATSPLHDSAVLVLWAAEHPDELAACEAKADQATAGWPDKPSTKRWREQLLNSELAAAYRRAQEATAVA